MTPLCYSYIRFSTPEQQNGDSLRRQLKMSEDYAREKGLVLDERLNLRDLGLSAFHGLNRSKGALGLFLAQIEEQKVPKGSTLLVESLDRLSREQVLDALEQFLAIIRAGVTVVTLADRMEYSTESVNANIGQLMFSLTIMSRAHEESQTKARRLRAAWDGKRDNIQSHKLTAICPEWLELNADRTAFRVIDARGEIIRQIFRAKLAGKGNRLIVHELNQQSAWLPSSRKRNSAQPSWHDSYVQKILRNPAVIGEYQPHTLSRKGDRRLREPVGEAILDYYPAVVSAELFHAVQHQMEQNRSLAGNGGGRPGKISNLFGHLAKCGYCGGSMAFVNKGRPPRGGTYLVCDVARRGLPDCKRYPIRYDEFEDLILTYCRNLNPGDFLPGNEERESVLKTLQGRAAALQGEVKGAAAKVANLADSIATTDNQAVRRLLEDRLGEALSQKESLQGESRQLEQEVSSHLRGKEDTVARLDSMRELLDFLREGTGEELIDVRRRLRQELRSIIDRIDVCPVGRKPMTLERVEEMQKAVLDVHPEMAGSEELKRAEAELMGRIENRDLRVYAVHFKGGSFRILEPVAKVPLSLDFNRELGKLDYLT